MKAVHIDTRNTKVVTSKNRYEGFGYKLQPEFVSWLEECVGEQGFDLDKKPSWFLDPNLHACALGEELFIYLTVWVKEPSAVMMLKLTWGGDNWLR